MEMNYILKTPNISQFKQQQLQHLASKDVNFAPPLVFALNVKNHL